jgi:Uma2 family endonuclease
MGAKTLLTVEQFEQLPAVEGISYELDEGELIEVPNASLLHNFVRDELLCRLNNHLLTGASRGMAVSEQSFRLSPETVRAPDVALIGPTQLTLVQWDAAIQPFCPALAVEVTSPSNTFSELTSKTKQYLSAGAHAVWIVVPPAQEIHVYRANAHPLILCAGDILDEPDLLPGFSAQLTDLFRV